MSVYVDNTNTAFADVQNNIALPRDPGVFSENINTCVRIVNVQLGLVVAREEAGREIDREAER